MMDWRSRKKKTKKEMDDNGNKRGIKPRRSCLRVLFSLTDALFTCFVSFTGVWSICFVWFTGVLFSVVSYVSCRGA